MVNRVKRIKRFKVLVGPAANQVQDGFDIGYQAYPNQFMIENVAEVPGFFPALYARGVREGVWLSESKIKIERTDHGNVKITDEGVNYSNDYIDLCVPFDRVGNEISVGDYLYVAVKNEVRKGKVVKIANKPYQGSYGIMRRKLTVVDEAENQTLTIHDCYTTMKC